MQIDQALESFAQLESAIDREPSLEEALRVRWHAGARRRAGDGVHELPAELARTADALARGLAQLTHDDADLEQLGQLVSSGRGRCLVTWCAASTWRRDVRLARLLWLASESEPAERVVAMARSRVVEGPLIDALLCAPLLGDGAALLTAENAEAVARLAILIWEAGSIALEIPELGQWIWGSPATFDALVKQPAHGSLLGRVLAARCLEMASRGLPPSTSPALVGQTLQILQPLLLHPEPLVWVHAARALGRLTGALEQLEGTLLDWVFGDSKLLRQRAVTAFASLPAERLSFLSSQLVAILESPDEEDWVLAAVAAATPYLYFERHSLWERLAKRILGGDGGAVASRALARGLATLWRRGSHQPAVEGPLRELRDRARIARPTQFDELRRWIEVVSVTDPIDGAERDPLDLEIGIDNLMRIAAQYDDEEADARAARFASSLSPTFQEAMRTAVGSGGRRTRAAAINALEGCARAFALRLWAPLLDTCPVGEPIEEPDLSGTWKQIAEAPAKLIELVKERRASGQEDAETLVALEVSAIRIGGYALDSSETAHERGATAHDTCLWIRKIEGLADGSRELPPALATSLSALFWRLVDTTRGTALGEVDDVQWLGPFAAWWALVIDRPDMLQQLATALPLMAPGALSTCCDRADILRASLSSDLADGEWREDAATALASLHAEGTELGEAILGLAQALAAFSSTAGPKPDLEQSCLALVLAGDRLHGALANPVKALHTASSASHDDSLTRSATDNAPRVAALVARAIRARDLSMLDVWLASLGPITSTLLEEAVRGAIRRTPPPPPVQKKEPKTIEGYELVKPLGEGGIGSVWLVRKPGADRLFVLKIPKADALASANEVEREGILASFVEEAKALAGLYHPNVANIIDRGVSKGFPFLVLEYLIGADLKEYSFARKMTLFELRQVVVESCAGLAALHNAGLVHRDIKPANLWLRLPLEGGQRFDPAKHRDPAHTPPLSSVVIDFGMVRSTRVAADAAGRFVAGTAGYIAPEQVLDPVELDPRADVYALVGTIYNVTTGRALFDEIENPRDRIIAHMRRDPFEDPERLREFPAAMAKVLRAGTAMNAADRPSPIEFARAFVAAL